MSEENPSNAKRGAPVTLHSAMACLPNLVSLTTLSNTNDLKSHELWVQRSFLVEHALKLRSFLKLLQ